MATKGAATERRPTYKALLLALIIILGSIFTPIKKGKKAKPNMPIVPRTCTLPSVIKLSARAFESIAGERRRPIVHKNYHNSKLSKLIDVNSKFLILQLDETLPMMICPSIHKLRFRYEQGI